MCKEKEFDFDVSFIVVSYNPDWNKLRNTLESIIKQKDIRFEVIVTDDGSAINYSNEMLEYFNDNNIKDFQLIMNKENQGTVLNLASGLDVARGKYVKDISPGDYLCGSTVTKKWIDFMQEREAEWSFSEAIFYRTEDNMMRVISCCAHPNDLKPYLRDDFQRCRWNYVVLNDIAVGATMLCKTEIYKKYCNKIINKVKYAEDNMWRIMMFDGITGIYYPKHTVFYEYGSGVSTSSNSIWGKKIADDWNVANKIMFCNKGCELDSFQHKMQRAYWMNKNPILKFFVRGKFFSAIKRKLYIRKTAEAIPEED